MIAWLTLAFVSMFRGLHIMSRNLRTSKPYEKMTGGDIFKGVMEGGL